MSITKQFNQKKQVYKVTFALPKDSVNAATQINLAGDFNNWNIESNPMKKNKKGEFSASVDLEKGREYEFKYIIDGKNWLNESEADRFVPNVFFSDNSVITL